MVRILVLVALLLVVCVTAGCHTVGGAAVGAAEGAKKDYQQVKKADVWLQDNLW
jgi:hypothetical protein